jgi:hypothetical protein
MPPSGLDRDQPSACVIWSPPRAEVTKAAAERPVTGIEMGVRRSPRKNVAAPSRFKPVPEVLSNTNGSIRSRRHLHLCVSIILYGKFPLIFRQVPRFKASPPEFAMMLQSRYNIPQKSLEMNVDPDRLFAHHSARVRS